MRRLLGFLLNPEVSLGRYCFYLVPLAIIPSAIIYWLARSFAQSFGLNVAAHGAPAMELTLGSALGTVIFAPVVETLLLAGVLALLSSASPRPVLCAVISSVLWGCLHGLFGALWFFGTAWSFFVFSCAYLSWRRTSFRQGFLAAAVPHASVNSIAMLLLWAA